MAEGQSVTLETTTLLDNPGTSPVNSLDPALAILDATGSTTLAADANSAADGKNARLSFTAPSAGTYLVAVSGESGTGEYVLDGSPSLDGDFNDDGLYNCDDIDALIIRIANGSSDTTFDLTGDGQLDLNDRDAWLAEAAAANGLPSPYRIADANLDGTVDGEDFLVWNANKFNDGDLGWCGGDFNADGLADGFDFILWNLNKFTGSERDGVLGTAGSHKLRHTERLQIALVTDVSPVEDRPVAPQPTLPGYAARVDRLFASVAARRDHAREAELTTDELDGIATRSGSEWRT